jgi:1,4-dihydroxy-2-naphthoyl-CoA hydrolase
VTYRDLSTSEERVRHLNQGAAWGPVPRMLGIEMLEVETDVVRGRIAVTDALLAGTGFLWAPVVVGLADALCAAGTGLNLREGASFTTVELKTNFLGSARAGEEIVGEACPAHLGRTTQVWDVTVANQTTGKAIALQRCTQMVLYPER